EMNSKQIAYFQCSLWPAACAAQGWDRNDREFRLEFISSVIGRRIESAKEVEERDEFTLLKNRCLRLADDLDGAIEDGSLVLNQRRNLLWIIEQLHVPAAVMNHFLRERFHGRILDDLNLVEVQQLLFTLNGWSNRHKRSAKTQNEPV